MSARRRTLRAMVHDAAAGYRDAVDAGLMQVTITKRDGKRVTLDDGREVTEFINCSYLGLDTRPDVIAAAARVVEDWGVHFCCARSRFTIAPNTALEDELSRLFRGYALTFPSVTSAHLSTLPLLASGVLLDLDDDTGVRLIFDRFAHASMQSLKPLLAVDATVVTIGHNDLQGLADEIARAEAAGEHPVFIADSVYSMGGVCPLDEVLALARAHPLSLYLDDAHGTSIFGDHGEGYVLSRIAGPLPANVFLAYSLAKGFGTNGGGVVLPSEEQRRRVRSFGQTYAFSAPLDFSIVAAARAALALHDDGTVGELQAQLRARVARFDRARGLTLPFSPIRMVALPSTEGAIEIGRALIARGFFVTVALYPVVPRDKPQLRVCLSVEHTDADIDGLTTALAELGV